MIKHHNLGDIIQNDWHEFYMAKTIHIPHFEQEVKVNLVEYDEDFEPIEETPSNQLLDEFAATLQDFLVNMNTIVDEIQTAAFERYLDVYAKYYEKPFEVIFENKNIQKSQNQELHPPLKINSKEKHFKYMNAILERIVISNNKTITMPLCYDLDEEHGLEIKIRNNKVIGVGGIGETTYE